MEPADYAEGAMVEGKINSTFDSLGDDCLQIGPETSRRHIVEYSEGICPREAISILEDR